MNVWKVAASLLTPLRVVFALNGCAPTAKSEGTGGYIDDTVITAKVKSELVRDDRLKAREINVETFKGRVQLSGFVGSATEAAWRFRPRAGLPAPSRWKTICKSNNPRLTCDIHRGRVGAPFSWPTTIRNDSPRQT